MIRYIITSHLHLEGVRLSKMGHWGNIPFPTDEEAREHAKSDAKAHPFTVEREYVRKRLCAVDGTHAPD